jgi:hypothetical protein
MFMNHQWIFADLSCPNPPVARGLEIRYVLHGPKSRNLLWEPSWELHISTNLNDRFRYFQESLLEKSGASSVLWNQIPLCVAPNIAHWPSIPLRVGRWTMPAGNVVTHGW